MEMGQHRSQRNWGPRGHEDVTRGMRAVTLETEKLPLSVLTGEDTDLFEFNDKPRDLNLVWLRAGSVRNSTAYLPSSPDLPATFVDHYLGG